MNNQLASDAVSEKTIRSQLRVEDIEAFLDVYGRTKLASSLRDSMQDLLSVRDRRTGEKVAVTTTISKLKRITEFFGLEEFAFPPPKRDSGLGLLFQKGQDKGFEPTAAADELFCRLSILWDFYGNIRAAVQNRFSHPAVPTVLIGAPGVIAFRLLPSIFSDWYELFGQRLNLTIAATGNSEELAARVEAGQLDFAIVYGPRRLQPVADKTLGVCFRSFDYKSRMTLICHPKCTLQSRDSNAGNLMERYAEQDRLRTKGMPYASLEQVTLEELDLRHVPLIVVRSWQQPERLQEVVEFAPRKPRVVETYEEAVSLVRMDMGVAVVSEVISKRRLVTAFRLQPEKDDEDGPFTRYVGLCYNKKLGLTPWACLVAEFIKGYVEDDAIAAIIRSGDPPGLADDSYATFCQGFKMPSWDEWERTSAEQYPAMDDKPNLDAKNVNEGRPPLARKRGRKKQQTNNE